MADACLRTFSDAVRAPFSSQVCDIELPAVSGCVWKLLLNFGSPKSVLGNPHHEVQKSQNTFKKAFA